MSKSRDVQPATGVGVNLPSLFEQLRPEVAKLISTPKVVERFLRVALTELRTKPELAACRKESILASIMMAAQLNLEIGGAMRHGYLIGYKGECTFQPSYIGLLALARRSKQFLDIDAVLVHDNDGFSFRRDPKPSLLHEPNLWNPGAELGAYVYATLVNGEPKFLSMHRAEIEKVRQSSNAPNSLMWSKYWGEGAKKTVLKRFLKTQELTPELAEAIEQDDREYRDVTGQVVAQEPPATRTGSTRAAALGARIRTQLPPPVAAEEVAAGDLPDLEDDGVASGAAEA